jgi:NO-binding membrane sensor protein with MHYT domain
MSFLRAVKAPLGVQLNRAAFTIYAAFFAWPLWSFRHSISVTGLVIFISFEFCSLLGLAYTFVRLRRSRWILAILGLVVPATVWMGMSLMEFSRPAWWEWPFDVVLILVVWMGIPIVLAVALFRDKKTNEYFRPEAT